MSPRDTTPPPLQGWNFDNTYVRLPDSLYVRQNPIPVPAPRMVIFNRALGESLGLNTQELDGHDGAAIFAGNLIPEGAQPIAQAA